MIEAVPTERFEEGSLDHAASYGRFQVRAVLGRGGMGLVLRAHDPKLGRDVALKLLAPERWDAATFGTQGLEREARALAQLSHPNVVTVYEMGTVGEQPFIAMELVDGVTLRAWISSGRTETEIIAMFAACARGLAAAHAANLVHRDFKPDNVLIGSDARPRVSDFGLVASELTGARGIAGTPAYMAPEQWLGSAVGAHTDQFAFCVALWEALTGARPFGNETTGEKLRDAVLSGRLRDEPRPRRALASILTQGLARDPAERWPSLDELIVELERAVARKRRRWIVVGLATAAVAGVLTWNAMRGGEDACAIRSARIHEDWNGIARARLSAAFTSAEPQTGSYFASYVSEMLDRYATSWSAAERAVCRAEPSEINARRAECLEDARGSFVRLVSLLTTANAAVVQQSGSAVDNLVEISACEDTVALAAALPPSSDPSIRSRITTILRDIDDAHAESLRGEHSTALAHTKSIVASARELGHAMSLALALEQQADLERDVGALAAAEASYRAGADAAADARHDRLAAKMWSQVLYVGAEQGGDLTRIIALEPVADAAVRRAGSPPNLRFSYLMSSGVLAAWRKDFATAIDRFAAAAELMKNNPRRRSEALGNLSIATFETVGAHEALSLARQWAEQAEQANGPNHVATAVALTNYADMCLRVGRLDEAERTLARASSIIEKRVGRHGSTRAAVLRNLGIAAGYRGDFARARVLFEQALAAVTDTAGTEYERGITLSAFASMFVAAKEPTEAVPRFESATSLLEQAVPNSGESHLVAVQYASALADLGRCNEARPILDRADPILRTAPHLHGDLLVTLGVCEAVQDKSRGLATLERALAHCGANRCELVLDVRTRWEVARRISDVARARLLAEEAHKLLVEAGVRTPMVTDLASFVASP